ncbi:GntR family transcriptional regulator [Terribacillus saccharophilus]|uniref:GntR family transcriptional regulator n=1 Tax=Terribacillus saccharophilus TaxID=361277 RepID=UPI0034611622
MDDDQPIFQQIADMIKEDIIDGELKEDEKVPSENELSQFYGINRATVRNGLQLLIDLDLVYKKRGIGMFVKPGARSWLINESQDRYLDDYIKPLLKEAQRIGLEVDSVIQLIKKETGK